MKHWKIDYSIRNIDGTMEELYSVLEARNITDAAIMARENIMKVWLKDPEVSDLVIWNIGIVEDRVFE